MDIKTKLFTNCRLWQKKNKPPKKQKKTGNCQSNDILTIFTCIYSCISCYERDIAFTLLRIISMHFNFWRFTRIFLLTLLTSTVFFYIIQHICLYLVLWPHFCLIKKKESRDQVRPRQKLLFFLPIGNRYMYFGA